MSKDYTYEDIDYAERFHIRVMTEAERGGFALSPEYVWVYECDNVQLFLTTEEAVRFVHDIGRDVENFMKKFSKSGEPLLF